MPDFERTYVLGAMLLLAALLAWIWYPTLPPLP